MAETTNYVITTEPVTLSMDWKITANDYQYTDFNRVDKKFETVKVDFQDLLVRVGARKAAVIEGEITPMATRMRTRNAYLANLSSILAELTRVQSGFSGDDAGSKTAFAKLELSLWNLLIAIDGASGMITESERKTDENGITTVSGKTTKAQVEGLVQLVKGEMDKENNAAQTDMTRLQSLVDSRDDSYSTTTNMMSAISDTRSNLIGNLSS